jgi:hypothetical protein
MSNSLKTQKEITTRELFKLTTSTETSQFPETLKFSQSSQSSQSSQFSKSSPTSQSSQSGRIKQPKKPKKSKQEKESSRLKHLEQLEKNKKNRYLSKRITILDIKPDILDEIIKTANPTYILRDWVIEYKLDFENISKNPNANNLLQKNLSDNKRINWQTLCLNPNAIHLLEYKLSEESKNNYIKNTYDRISWYNLSSNPNAIHLLEKQIEKEKQLTDTQLSRIEKHYKIDWTQLSGNKNAIHLLKANPIKIVWNEFASNKNLDIELLKTKIENEKKGITVEFDKRINYKKLWKNPNTKVITLLLELYPLNINWQAISENTNSIAIQRIKIHIEEKKAKETSINWFYLSELSRNPKAINILIENPDVIDWQYLSSNPKAIALLEERISEETKMSEFTSNKICWIYLSANPKAIHLLKKNPENIDNNFLCKNPNAVKLLRERIDSFSILDWKELSMNPSIFKKQKK